MVSLVVAATAMAWLMMDHTGHETPIIVTGTFLLFFLALLWKNQYMKGEFVIPPEAMTQGDVRLNLGAAEVDVSRLEAGETAAACFPDAPTAPSGGASSSSDAGPWVPPACRNGRPPTTTPITFVDTLLGGRQYEEKRDSALYTR